jgi:enterochelin esterase-like enzyme
MKIRAAALTGFLLFTATVAAQAPRQGPPPITCGTEDNRIEALTKVEADLRARQINFTFKRYPGEHEWKVWRHSLVDMAPLLFR